jgi:DNA-binding response OmpR family regulator
MEQPAPEKELADRREYRGKCILLCAGDEARVSLLDAELEREGYDVLATHTMAELLANAQAEHPSAIALDVMLVSPTPFDAIHLLGREPCARDIPILVVGAEASVFRGWRSGVNLQLDEPFRLRNVVDWMRTVFRR